MKLNSVMWTSECVARIRVVQITFSYKIRMRCTRSYMSNIQIAIFSETLRQHNCFDLKLSMQELLIDSPILTFKLILNVTFLTLFLLKSSFLLSKNFPTWSLLMKRHSSVKPGSHLHFIFQMNTHHRLIQSGRKLHNSNYFLLTSF